MKQIFLYIWQLPQHLLGLFIWVILKTTKQTLKPFKLQDYPDCLIIPTTGQSFCTGKYVFVYKDYCENLLKHEIGHSIQSKYLGPLFIIVFGIPSICAVIGREAHRKLSKEEKYRWYFSRFPENWANKLGGANWFN